MNDQGLIVGLPAGSLADPKRGGNLITLLAEAGFRSRGYESGGPSSFANLSFYYGWDGRPQEFGSQLGIGELDLAIAGDDWITERLLELEIEYSTAVELEKVLSLKRGDVRIVGIASPERGNTNDVDEFFRKLTGEKERLDIVSEMPYLALDWVKRRLKAIDLWEQYKNYSVQKYKTPPRIEKGVVIYETWGKTESKVKNGGADVGLEITQSGSAIRNYGLSIIDTVMNSETGIWIAPRIRENKEKAELLDMLLVNLFGVINAENKLLLIFNMPNKGCRDIEQFLSKHNLYADEPTKNRGEYFTEYSIQVETENPQVPLARIRYELAKRGAKNIDTVPLSSSIPSIEVIQQ